MSGSSARTELGQFLRARRGELKPAAMGLSDAGTRRRVPGLRRGEVANLASISTEYYTRLEQGRIQASSAVLTALAAVLRLDPDQRDYMFELAQKVPIGGERSRRPPGQRTVRPTLRRLLDTLTGVPAIVLGRRMDILAWNPLAAALLVDFGAVPPDQRNYARLLFLDPQMRERYTPWDSHARDCVAFLRMDAARGSDDPRLSALVGELSLRSDDFRRWWAGQHVAHRAFGTKTLRHPLVGEVTLDWECFSSSADSDQQLVIWTAEPGTGSHEALGLLASWTETTV